MDGTEIARRFKRVAPFLDERLRRIVAAGEAEAVGYGGISLVSRVTGVSRRAIALGFQELTAPGPTPAKRIRREGAGRKRTVDKDPTLRRDLEALVEPVTRGDPESPLRWTCKSVRRLADGGSTSN